LGGSVLKGGRKPEHRLITLGNKKLRQRGGCGGGVWGGGGGVGGGGGLGGGGVGGCGAMKGLK